MKILLKLYFAIPCTMPNINIGRKSVQKERKEKRKEQKIGW